MDAEQQLTGDAPVEADERVPCVGGVFEHVLKRLEDAEVHGALDLGRVALDVARLELDGDRRPRRRRLERVAQSALAEQRRVHAVGQRPELVERVLDLLFELA